MNMNKLAKQISIKKHCFTYNNVLYERLYNHSHKYRFFFDEDYDYVENIKLENKLNAVYINR